MLKNIVIFEMVALACHFSLRPLASSVAQHHTALAALQANKLSFNQSNHKN
jgi:hypothetical protein